MAEYYAGYSLEFFAASLNQGLNEFGSAKGLALGFAFSNFGAPYEPTAWLTNIVPVVNNRQVIWPS